LGLPRQRQEVVAGYVDHAQSNRRREPRVRSRLTAAWLVDDDNLAFSPSLFSAKGSSLRA
jgi:hypothetical protein